MGSQPQHTLTYNRTVARRRLRAFLHDDRGVSAVEFALIAPMLTFALLAMVDIGLAISERMTIGHVLRAGAQGAAEDIGESAVDQVLRTTAEKTMKVAAISEDDTALALNVTVLHACPEAPSTPVERGTTCDGDTPTGIFYVLSATKTYDALFLPRFSQTRELWVQVR
ncbi:TadE/TadG family type IV pilus assembly protein [Natronohydrobacter thiooxidans]|uniref:TadE/TadG family type IV pilus assembly protein n=1 Tax=Natronohydrobacter thiooxidans TaxID=87172 RepID=UPI0008FF3DF4|nr:TadE/TadG family type IV pilus assembly protein [Natronohydrobacter thiooxidans]